MDYDILILGGGIIGCALSYELAKYNYNIAVIEKDFDIADDISFVNTSIVYDGSETSDNIMAGLEYIGSNILEEICNKFNVPFKRIGCLRVVSDDNGVKKLETMYERAKNRGIEGVSLIEPEEVLKLEPNIKTDIKKGLLSKNVAIMSPYDLAIAYAEVASDNGVNFRLEEEVLNISRVNHSFRVTTNKNKFSCKIVINTIPNELFIQEDGAVQETDDEEQDNTFKNMSYLIVDDNYEKKLNRVVIETFDKDTFVLSTPTTTFGSMIGIKTTEKTSLDDNLNLASRLVNNLGKCHINNLFRESYDKDKMLIDEADVSKGYIRIAGTHYGKITIAPAIAQMVAETLQSKFNSSINKNFIDKRREFYKVINLSDEEWKEIISLDNRYGKVICTCNCITEGEIVDSIRRPLGARTVEGVKRRTGAGYGPCNGSYCNDKIISILARELDRREIDIVDDSKDSNIIAGRIKEFNEV